MRNNEIMDKFSEFLDSPHRREWLFLSLPGPRAETLTDSSSGHIAAVQESMAILFSSVHRLLHLYAVWKLEGGADRPEVERCVRERQVNAEARYLIDQAFPDWTHKYSRVCGLGKHLDIACDYDAWLERIIGSVAEMLRMALGIVPPDLLPEVPLTLQSFIHI